jgi:hypothetical protein
MSYMNSQNTGANARRSRPRSAALAAALKVALAEEAAEALAESTQESAKRVAQESNPEDSEPSVAAPRQNFVSRPRGLTPGPAMPLDAMYSPYKGRPSTEAPADDALELDAHETRAQREPMWSQWSRMNLNEALGVELQAPESPAPLRRSRSHDNLQRSREARSARIPALNNASALQPLHPIILDKDKDRLPLVLNILEQAEAAAALTPAERDKISRRLAKQNVQPGLEPKRQNLRAQEDLIDGFERTVEPVQYRNIPTVPARTISSRPRTREPTARSEGARSINRPPAMSYLGRMLENMTRLHTRNRPGDLSDPSSSDSSSEDGHGRDPLRQRHESRHARKSKSRDNHRDKKTTLKPIVPREYGGAADSRLFYRFVTEGTSVVKAQALQKSPGLGSAYKAQASPNHRPSPKPAIGLGPAWLGPKPGLWVYFWNPARDAT